MKTLKTKFFLAATVAATTVMGFAGTASAAKIGGGISFTGGYTPTNGTDKTALSDATTIDFQQDAFRAGQCTGDFADYVTCDPFTGDLGTIKDLTFDPFSATVDSFWEIGGFVFDLTKIVVAGHDGNSLELNGSGIISGNGFDDTQGTWDFTANAGGGTFTWSSSTAVPEPATMLGLGLVAGAGFLASRRKQEVEA